MTPRNRHGFTLVELLVVITIISMLVALLVPAVLAARKAAQKAKCFNNQAELSKALQQFEVAKQHFPGYVNHFGDRWDANGQPVGTPQAQNLSWMVVCLPYLGREDLWRQWRDNGPDANRRVRVEQFMCPADAPPEDHATSYVANCGTPGPDGPAYGVFHDHTVSPQVRSLVAASNIPDGAQSTLMISENVQANLWYDMTDTDVGMLWQSTPGSCGQINLCLDHGSTTGGDVDLARPSSLHSGGVVVSFCDGHQDFLREDINYAVYQHLMTPDSNAAGISGTLSEGDY